MDWMDRLQGEGQIGRDRVVHAECCFTLTSAGANTILTSSLAT